MTKEEIARTVAYCDGNKISYKQRLSEQGGQDPKDAGKNFCRDVNAGEDILQYMSCRIWQAAPEYLRR